MKDQQLQPAPGSAGAPQSERWMHGATAETGHRGKGPKNYVRSDARIFEDVGEMLSHHDSIDASDVTVAVEHGEVMLDGVVETQRMKEIAEETITGVAGVKCVRNRLRTKGA